MNDLTWFKWYQPQLLGLANTNEGRDLLGIDQGVPTIIEVMPWYVTWIIGKGEYQSEFHSRAVFFRRVMHRWKEVSAAMEWQANSFLARRGGHLLVPAGGATLTAYPDAHTESATVDGQIGWGGLDDRINWATATGDGNTSNSVSDDGATINCTAFQRSGTWEDFIRGYFLFDTSGISTANAVSAAVFSFTSSQTGNGADEDTFCVVSSNPASNTALVAGDYDTHGTTDFGNIESGSGTISTDSATYNDITLNSSGRSAISLDSITKLGFRWEADRANAEPSSATSGSQIIILAADTASTSKDPKLVVTHAVASETEKVNDVALSSIQDFNDVTAANGQAINGVDF
jgi:hypothetical protein